MDPTASVARSPAVTRAVAAHVAEREYHNGCAWAAWALFCPWATVMAFDAFANWLRWRRYARD
jgi:hypothetical protein